MSMMPFKEPLWKSERNTSDSPLQVQFVCGFCTQEAQQLAKQTRITMIGDVAVDSFPALVRITTWTVAHIRSELCCSMAARRSVSTTAPKTRVKPTANTNMYPRVTKGRTHNRFTVFFGWTKYVSTFESRFIRENGRRGDQADTFSCIQDPNTAVRVQRHDMRTKTARQEDYMKQHTQTHTHRSEFVQK